jgi:uncharacterized protein
VSKRLLRHTAILFLFLLGLLAVKIWTDTMGAPQIRRATVATAQLPPGSPSVTIALISDIHVAGPDMPPARLEEIVAQVNALRPDLVMIAGDLVSEKRLATRHYSAAAAVAPLGELRAVLGVVAVPGNHDHWFGWPELRAELKRQGIRVLANEAAQIGPLAIGGLDDDFTRRADVRGTLAAMGALEGPRVILSHSPDPFPDVPVDVSLFLAGHTHCGQIAWPWGGSPATMSDFGDRYACGRVVERGKLLITSGGLGTSLLPVRFFTSPEIWLVTVRPAQ